jgi:hypothetical protein
VGTPEAGVLPVSNRIVPIKALRGEWRWPVGFIAASLFRSIQVSRLAGAPFPGFDASSPAIQHSAFFILPSPRGGFGRHCQVLEWSLVGA